MKTYLESLTEAREIAFKTVDGLDLDLPEYKIIEAIDRAIAEARQNEAVGDFQARTASWMQACFGTEISQDKIERGDRLLEEVFETPQSVDYPRERVREMEAYTWNRPKGDLPQEVGGVMVTLAAFCLAHGIDMHAAGETELARVWTKIDKIRAKQAAKPKHSPLPEAAILDARKSEGDDESELAIQSLAETIADPRGEPLTSTVSQAIFNALCPGVRQTTEDRTNYKEAARMAIAAVDNHRYHFQQDAILTEREACAEIADSYQRAGRQMVAANSIAYAIRHRPSPSPGVSAPARVGSEEEITKLRAENALLKAAQGKSARARRRIRRINKFDGDKAAIALARKLEVVKAELAALRSSAGTFEEGVEAAAKSVDSAAFDLIHGTFGEMSPARSSVISKCQDLAKVIRALTKKDAPK